MRIRKKQRRIKGRLYEIGEPTYIGKIPESRKKDIDVCIWAEDESYRWTIAVLEWDAKEPCYELRSIGMRLAKYGNTELLEWLLEIAELYESKARMED